MALMVEARRKQRKMCNEIVVRRAKVPLIMGMVGCRVVVGSWWYCRAIHTLHGGGNDGRQTMVIAKVLYGCVEYNPAPKSNEHIFYGRDFESALAQAK